MVEEVVWGGVASGSDLVEERASVAGERTRLMVERIPLAGGAGLVEEGGLVALAEDSRRSAAAWNSADVP